MNIISSNPYRLFGVYSNSSTKNRIANANKLNAYLKVGKPITFPLDLSDLMLPPIRTVESIEHANGSINLPKDQLRYALFWFVKVTSIDEIALSYLQKGDAEKAKELFAKKETFSSLINLGVLALVQNDMATAIQSITKVIHEDDYRTAFVMAICGSTYQLSEGDLIQLFIDELLEEFPVQKVRTLFREYGTAGEIDGYLKNKIIGEPIVVINTEIAKARSFKNDDADAQYIAGISLMNRTKEPLGVIRSVLKMSDMQYQMIVDNLAKQILQCSINYYNNSKEPDAAIKAMSIQKYALQIAVGALIKDRCKENVNILQKIIDNLPPMEVFIVDSVIREKLVAFSEKRKPWENGSFYLSHVGFEPTVDDLENVLLLLHTVKPHLETIKDRVGFSGDYYWKMSELVVGCALSYLVDYVNIINNSQLSPLLSFNREQTLRKLRAVVKNSMQVMNVLNTFDMTDEFRTTRYNPNKNTLTSLSKQLNISCQSSNQNSNSGCMVWIAIAIVSLIVISSL